MDYIHWELAGTPQAATHVLNPQNILHQPAIEAPQNPLDLDLETRAGPADPEWETHRATIKHLYVNEDKSLKEVMAIMANEYGHKGSVKMYKSRITRWKLDKKNKEHEMAMILRKKQQRDAIGKASSFRVRGRAISNKELLRYCNRKKKIGRDVAAVSPAASSTSDISCFTPTETQFVPDFASDYDRLHGRQSLSHSRSLRFDKDKSAEAAAVPHIHPLRSPRYNVGATGLCHNTPHYHGNFSMPQVVALPDSLMISYALFASIDGYYSRSIGTEQWKDGSDGLLYSSKTSTTANALDMHNYVLHATELFHRQRFIEGRNALSKAFELIKVLLLIEDPRTLSTLLSTIINLLHDAEHQIVSMLTKYLGAMASTILPRTNPLRQICQLIASLDDYNLSLLGYLHLCISDTLQRELGEFHLNAMYSRIQYFTHVLMTNTISLRDAEHRLRDLLPRSEQACGNSDFRFTSIMQGLIANLVDQERCLDAERIILNDFGRISNGGNSDLVASLLYVLSLCQHKICKYDLAERSLRAAIDEQAGEYGWENSTALHYMLDLENLLRDWGRVEEADAMMEKYKNLMGLDDLAEEVLEDEALQEQDLENGGMPQQDFGSPGLREPVLDDGESQRWSPEQRGLQLPHLGTGGLQEQYLEHWGV